MGPINADLQAPSIPVTESDAALVARRIYGLSGSVRRLGGERDDNFLLTVREGERYLLKVAHPLEDPQVTNLQGAVLMFLEERAPEIRVQRVIRADGGATDVTLEEGPTSGRTVRLTTFLEGGLMRAATPSPELRTHVGATAASLDRALATFDHPATTRHLLWDIQRASDLRPLIESLHEPEERKILLEELDRFEDVALRKLAGLRSQAIHNDLSTDNLLVTPDGRRVSGVLDFGDIVYAPAVNELAVAISYQLGATSDLVGAALDVVDGYRSNASLCEEELALLPWLVRARVLTWVTIPRWRSAHGLGDPRYVLRNAERSWNLLCALRAVSLDEFAERLVGSMNEEG